MIVGLARQEIPGMGSPGATQISARIHYSFSTIKQQDRLKLSIDHKALYVKVLLIYPEGLILGRVVGTRGVYDDIWIDDLIEVDINLVTDIIRG